MGKPSIGLPIIPTIMCGDKQFHWINDTVKAELIRCDHTRGKCPGCGSTSIKKAAEIAEQADHLSTPPA